MKLGATGKFPKGKLNEDDEGELTLAVGREGGVVMIHFGKPVAWIGLPPEQAKEFGERLIHWAKEITG